MAIPTRLTVLAALLLTALAARNAVGEIEVQTGRVVGERFGSGPVNFTADPFHKFDPMGGLRQLDRVIINAGADWECVVQLANPEPVVQEVRYNALPSSALLRTDTGPYIQLHLLAQPDGVLIADPFQTVQNVHAIPLGAGFSQTIEPNEPPAFQPFIGPGPLGFDEFEFGTAFDTFRFLNGIPMGAPNGFSVFRERWDVQVTYTYEFTIVPTPSAAALLAVLALTKRSRRCPWR